MKILTEKQYQEALANAWIDGYKEGENFAITNQMLDKFTPNQIRAAFDIEPVKPLDPDFLAYYFRSDC